jgi:hypothetical protein
MANLFVNFPTFQEPPMPNETNLAVKFDFTHYGAQADAKIITLPDTQCQKANFVVVAEANGLSVGRPYTITFELLNPSTNRQVFDPPVITLFASSSTQKFTTIANVDAQYNYILKATIKQTDTQLSASDIVAVSCNTLPIMPTPTPTPTLAMVSRVFFDNRPIMEIEPPNRCSEQVNIIATIFNAYIGKTYRYEFIPLTADANFTLSPASGFITAGFTEQNINTILTINENVGSLFSLQVKVYDAKYPSVLVDEDILLIRCYECK